MNLPTLHSLLAPWAIGNGLTGSDAVSISIPFDDDVENLLKYAFFMDGSGPDVHVLVPSTGDSGLPVTEVIGTGPDRKFRFEYIRRIGSGLTYQPQISGTMENGSWVNTTATPTVTPIDGDRERAVVEERIDEAATEVFGRVEVTLPLP